MKYLAILHDSFREALDSKVLYVLLALSGLLTLLVASVSFRPLSLEEDATGFTRELDFLFRFVFQVSGYTSEILDVQQEGDTTEPWRSNYRFTLRLAFPNDKDARKVPTFLVRQMLQDRFAFLSNLEVRPGQSSDPKELRYTVASQATPASTYRNWPHEPSLLFGAVPLPFLRSTLGYRVYWIEDKLVNGLGAWAAILVGVVITAFFIPNMLRKGSVDLLLVKPIHRSTLLLVKYVGGLTFLFVNAAVAVLGIWLALGLRSGIWAPGFLLTIFVLTFFFAILYAVSTLVGVLTRSPVVAILVTCVVWFLLWAAGLGYSLLYSLRDVETTRPPIPSEEDFRLPIRLPEWVYPVADAVHLVLPRTKDLDLLTTRLLSRDLLTEGEIRALKLDQATPLSWGESLTVSGVFIGLMLGLACWRFATKDY
jgi:ABC-type transport system involved in multi-copper enzyme maturation permease subunit